MNSSPVQKHSITDIVKPTFSYSPIELTSNNKLVASGSSSQPTISMLLTGNSGGSNYSIQGRQSVGAIPCTTVTTNTTTSSAVQEQLKSFQQASLITSMRHGSASMPSEMLLNYHQETDSKSTGNSDTSRQLVGNEVRNVMLYGIPIVSLVMDGQERLCLAQISNTLLKNFSYNEIHNRRVALGITCIQCTPVQLELLRRAGAMPVSSRRCGMITKREAERLCKSFLAETSPPKLPETFSFDVYHSCAWGCRGSFTPSRYNSSRAKCIKCVYCGLFFSPNKFIFHSHRLPTSKYIQPDAANFNSWRRHIRLVGNPDPPDHVTYAWEDVKAMFNGGSRKRAMTCTLNSFTKNQEQMNSEKAAAQSSAKFKYTEDNEGIEDSDDYCSMDASKHRIDVGSNDMQTDGTDVNSNTSHYTHSSQRTLLDGHFRKALEENGTNRKEPTIISSPSLSSSPASTPPPPSRAVSNEVSFYSKPDLHSTSFSSTEYDVKGKVMNSSESTTSPSHPTYLTHAGSELTNSYNLFGNGNFIMNRSQMAPPVGTTSSTNSAPHPAILNTLLTGVPEGSNNLSHFRSSVLAPGYVPLPQAGGTELTSRNLMTSPSTTSSNLPSTVTPTSVDFRHNLAEFMWSMASKANSQSLPYNFLWQPANSVNSVSSTTALQPNISLPISHSSSTSSTPNLSPTNNCDSSGDNIPLTTGFFPFKTGSVTPSTNSEEIRKALLLHHHQQQIQRNNTLAPFSSSQVNTNHSLPLIPNLIGHNLRLMPTQPNSANYFIGREFGETNEPSGQRQSKSPEVSPISGTIFPFYPAVTSSLIPPPSNNASSIDRFSSEMLAARNQLLFDAYNANLANQRHIFPSRASLFHSSLFLDSNSAGKSFLTEQIPNRDDLDNADKAVDVIGDDDEDNEVALSLKSIYPLSYHTVADNKNSNKTNNFTCKMKKSLKRTSLNYENKDICKIRKNVKKGGTKPVKKLKPFVSVDISGTNLNLLEKIDKNVGDVGELSKSNSVDEDTNDTSQINGKSEAKECEKQESGIIGKGCLNLSEASSQSEYDNPNTNNINNNNNSQYHNPNTNSSKMFMLINENGHSNSIKLIT